jgi:hypothetical protein
MQGYARFQRHPTRERIAVNAKAVVAVESEIPADIQRVGVARIVTRTGKEYVVEGDLERTLKALEAALAEPVPPPAEPAPPPPATTPEA